MVVSRPRSRSRASCRCCRAASTRCRCCWTAPCPRASTRQSWSCTWRRRTSRRGWAWPSPSTTSCPRGSKPNSRRSAVCFKQRRESWERISYFLLCCSVCLREDLLYACATLGIFVKFGMRLRWAPLSFYYFFCNISVYFYYFQFLSACGIIIGQGKLQNFAFSTRSNFIFVFFSLHKPIICFYPQKKLKGRDYLIWLALTTTIRKL